MIDAKIISQLLIMQSVAISLPDEKSIFSLVCRGLLDMPGVTAVRYSDTPQEHEDASTVRIPLLINLTYWGELLFTVKDKKAFVPYIDYLNNFAYVLAVILEERSQRRQKDLLQSQLEEHVQERTRQLQDEIIERKKAEEAQHESKLRLEMAIQASNTGLWDWDLKTNKVYYSPEWKGQLGYEDHEILDDFSEWESRIHPDDLEQAKKNISDYIEKPYPNYFNEFRMLHKDGSSRWILAQASLLFDEQGKPTRMMGSHIDITERKKMDELLRASLRVSEFALKHSLDELITKSLDEAELLTESQIGFFHFLDADQKTIQLQNWSTNTLQKMCTAKGKGQHYSVDQAGVWVDCIHERRPVIHNNYAALPHRKGMPEGHAPVVRELVMPIFRGDNIVGIIGVGNKPGEYDEKDIVIVSRLANLIWEIVLTKRAEEELWKYREHLEELVKERTTELDKKAEELQESRNALMNLVEDLNSKSAELEAANIKLKELDRLKSLFIASMSHELRTPLNSVIGFSSILLKEWEGPLNEEQKNFASIILKSGKHLLALINDVIDVSKIEAGQIESNYEDFDLYDVITEAVNLMKKDIIEKGLELEVESIHQTLHTDRRRLLQCVLNLMSNASKFTLKGTVRIVARCKLQDASEEQKQIVTSGKLQDASGRQGQTDASNKVQDASEMQTDRSSLLETCDLKLATDFIEISVEDTGIGIRKEDMHRLFGAFVRLESPIKTLVLGTGLGLYLTKKLVTEVLKGEIMVESTYEKGSKFTIRIPIRINK